MRKLSFLVILLAALTFTSCETQLFNCISEQGDKEWHELSLEAFHSVHASGNVKITFQHGEQNVQVFTTQNVVDAILENSNIVDSVWDAKIANCTRIGQIEYIITLPTLESVKISGKGDILTEGELKNLNTLDLTVSGSADFDMDFDSLQHLTMNVSGSGSFNMSGIANSADIDISGSGTVQNFDLITNSCDIGISGSADCEVHVLDELNVRFSGSGSVCYKGTPAINTDISGSGDVNNCN